ncbi:MULTISPECIES: hypothetical protein [unclassified Streptomyces]|uniref:hypothetical protein n=1 Tax=unclassified Streptomyces TaxID=2593676 RepID=UPI00202518E5|nr:MULTISPECIES: hypothetical protein [unclassified Streptomyces]WSC20383.1 hypothetical protein OIE60_12190 [Streptomyces sp. NBC_01766]
MESRELWERHAVLADAFCGADDHVRRAQSVFDGAQAERARMLAAFAITVGSDGAVADMLGLNEREVRVARRTVGKDDARSLADTLLTRPSDEQPEPDAVQQEDADSFLLPASGNPGYPTPPAPAQPPIPPPRTEQFPAPAPDVPMAGPEWSPALDAFLVEGWNNGIDVVALAAQLGIELAQLVSRAQHLSAEGRLAQVRRDAGRHRRTAGDPGSVTQPSPDAGYFMGPPSGAAWPPPGPGVMAAGPWQGDTQHQVPYEQYGQYGQYEQYGQYAQYAQPGYGWGPDASGALPRRDWDGILHDWERSYPADR